MLFRVRSCVAIDGLTVYQPQAEQRLVSRPPTHAVPVRTAASRQRWLLHFRTRRHIALRDLGCRKNSDISPLIVSDAVHRLKMGRGAGATRLAELPAGDP